MENRKNTIIKKTIEIAKILCFIVVFLVLLEFVSRQFFPEDIATSYKNNLRDAYSYVNEPNNSIDIVCTGNSDLYSAFCPTDLWNYYGYTSTVCASAKQNIQQSMHLMERVFERQNPELVIIETDMLYGYNIKAEKKRAKTNNNMTEFFDKLNPEYFDNEVSHRFSVFEFHNKWQKQGDDNQPLYSTHGYRYNCTICPLQSTDYMKPTSKVTPISSVKIERMDKLVSFCKEHGADVLLVEMPTISSWNYKRHNAVSQYAESRNLTFVDLNMYTEEIGINPDFSYRDNGIHLNYYGARAVTLWMGDYLEQHYKFQNHKDDKAYSNWDEDYKLLSKRVEYDVAKKVEKRYDDEEDAPKKK